MRIAIYTRVSPFHDTFQAEHHLSQQETMCKKFMQEREWRTSKVTVLRDQAPHETSHERPGYCELLRMIAAEEIDIVLMTTLRRLSSSYDMYLNLLHLTAKYRVLLITVAEGVLTTELQLTNGLLKNTGIRAYTESLQEG